MAAADAELDKAGGFGQVSKDLFSGAVGGIAQVLIGMLKIPNIELLKLTKLRSTFW
jgi:hypothetical protein